MIRQLSAIMFTDMVGYTALMQEDERRAMQYRDRQREVLKRLIDQHDGEILQYYGDGALSVFQSAIHAVECAISIQEELSREPRVPLRIGIHIGDVVRDDEGVFAWQHYRAARRIRFGDDNLPNPVWKFLDLDPASELTKLDDEIVRLVAPYVEDLLSRGLLFGCGLRNNPPIVCPQRQARVNTIAILVTVGEWDPPSQKEIEDDKDFPKDLSKSSVFAPYVKVFNDLGCLEPGTNPPDEVRPFRKTTKLQAAVWYYCFSQNLQTEN